MSNQPIIQHDPASSERKATRREKKFNQSAVRYLRYYWQDSPYFRRFFPAAIAVGLLCLLANFVSIITAFTFVKVNIEKWAGSSAAIAFTLLFLVGWEIVKYAADHHIWKHYYLTNLFDHKAIVLSLLLVTCSIFMSYNGGSDVVFEYSSKPTLFNTDSIAQVYNDQIAAIDKKITFWQDRLKDKDDWTARAKTIPALEKEASKLRSERQNALVNAEAKNDRKLLISNEKTTINATHVASAGALADLLLKLGILFLVRFHFYSADDYQDREDVENEEEEIIPEVVPKPNTRKPNPILSPTERIAAARSTAETPKLSSENFRTESHETQGVSTETAQKVSVEILHVSTDATDLIRNIRNYYRRRLDAKTDEGRADNFRKYIKAKQELEKMGYSVAPKPGTKKTLNIKKPEPSHKAL